MLGFKTDGKPSLLSERTQKLSYKQHFSTAPWKCLMEKDFRLSSDLLRGGEALHLQHAHPHRASRQVGLCARLLESAGVVDGGEGDAGCKEHRALVQRPDGGQPTASTTEMLRYQTRTGGNSPAPFGSFSTSESTSSPSKWSSRVSRLSMMLLMSAAILFSAEVAAWLSGLTDISEHHEPEPRGAGEEEGAGLSASP